MTEQKEEENMKTVDINIWNSDGTLWRGYNGKLAYQNTTMTDDGFFRVNCVAYEVVIEDVEE